MEYTNTIVISAVNLVNGGTFTILKECLYSLTNNKNFSNYKIFALVNSSEGLVTSTNISYIEYKKPKKNYFFRLFYEYIYFYFLSKKIKPKIWFSLHDITPNVKAKNRFVYFHNPSPFYKHQSENKLSLNFWLWTKLYKYIYKINVQKNTAVIVQQEWLRKAISDICKIPESKIIVAYPEIGARKIATGFEKNLFFYPSFPRVFKNFEVICKACELLWTENLPCWNVVLTLSAELNDYAKLLVEKYQHIANVHFVGLLSLEKVYEYYDRAECLIFPSRLETWGLPISEFKTSGKKMLLADLPYAHETANNAKTVCFFNQESPEELYTLMKKIIKNEYLELERGGQNQPHQPFCKNWNSLLQTICILSEQVK